MNHEQGFGGEQRSLDPRVELKDKLRRVIDIEIKIEDLHKLIEETEAAQTQAILDLQQAQNRMLEEDPSFDLNEFMSRIEAATLPVDEDPGYEKPFDLGSDSEI